MTQVFQGWSDQVLSDGHRIVLAQVSGSQSYVQIVPGTPPHFPTRSANTFIVTAADLGMKRIEQLIILGDTSGSFTGHSYTPPVSTNGEGAGGSGRIVVVSWNNAVDGTEVTAGTDLSAARLNVIAIGLG